jgi:hypothetical protein
MGRRFFSLSFWGARYRLVEPGGYIAGRPTTPQYTPTDRREISASPSSHFSTLLLTRSKLRPDERSPGQLECFYAPVARLGRYEVQDGSSPTGAQIHCATVPEIIERRTAGFRARTNRGPEDRSPTPFA